MNGWAKSPWLPESAAVVSDLTGWAEDAVRERFGEIVLVRYSATGGIEFRPGPPSPEQMRARVSSILAEGMK